jgi:hypothetical protein
MRRPLGIDGVREYIDRHYAAPLNVGQLARKRVYIPTCFIRMYRAD